jgi:hypothetical protein
VTRKDYQLIADVLFDYKADEKLIQLFAKRLEDRYSNFKKSVFLEACDPFLSNCVSTFVQMQDEHK